MNVPIFTMADKVWRGLVGDAGLAELQFELEVHKQLLNIFQVGDYYYMIFNLHDTRFDKVSESIRQVLGYEPEDVDVPFFLSNIHPEDQPWFLTFEQKVVEFFNSLAPAQTPNYKVRYDYRIKKKDGSYIRVLQQVVTIQQEENKVLRTLVVHTDITHIKRTGKPVLSFIGMNGEPSYVDVDVKNLLAPAPEMLSPREKEVLRLLIEGMDSRHIGEALFISKLTVDTHRKNLLKKTGCTNTATLIAAAIKKGWI
ncbi:hypothetical protein GCM10023093_00080 [Nemorincola caseinilytica]|uniref:PAS domain-containing protein n=1 Tax=Nemorincola caseinilytica TaxID=2054315 RepID=A0ABP8N0N9_9BACT